MEDKHAYFLLSTSRVSDLTVDYQTVISNNPALSGMFATLTGHNNTVKSMAEKLETSSKASTEASDAIRDKAAEDFSIMASVISSFGASTNNIELKGMSRFTHTKLRRATLTTQITDSAIILAAVTANATALADYNVEATDISDLQDTGTQLEELTKIPQKVIDQHKIDKKLLVDQLDVIHRLFDEQMDTAMKLYKKKNPEFFLAYIAARKVRHHHQKRKYQPPDPETATGKLEILVYDKGTTEPLPGVQLSVPALALVVSSDEDAEIFADMLTPGEYPASLFFDGYKTIDFTLAIEAGKTATLQFLMEKATV